MAGFSFFALLDDVSTLLDDIAAMTRVAAKQTAGVLGDDLALNAEQVTGMGQEREWPVVWAVCKGALLNKMILVPAALVISAFLPQVIPWLLLLGGTFLCFEGFHKVYHYFYTRAKHQEDDPAAEEHAKEILDALSGVDPAAYEKERVKGAIRTDFILSAEIIVLTLGVVSTQSLPVQLGVLAAISMIATLGVYGLVAGIVKIDNLGLYLTQRPNDRVLASAGHALGRGMLRAAPWIMKSLSVIGTIAMFLVGGGLYAHNIHAIGDILASWAAATGALSGLVGFILPGFFGLLVGALVNLIIAVASRILPRKKTQKLPTKISQI